MKINSSQRSEIAKSSRDLKPNSSDATKLILLLVLLNSADTFLTSLALDLGATEFNPIVAVVLNEGMTWFLFYKLILTNLMIVFVGFFSQKHHISEVGLRIGACVYSILTLWHLGNLVLMFTTG